MNVLFAVTSADTLAPGHPTGLWLEEYAIPWCALTEAGVEVTVASPKGGAAPVDPKSAPNEKNALIWRPAIEALATTARLAEVSAADFEAIFIPGGHGPMVDLVSDADLHALIGAFDAAGKIISAICHGPAALLPILQGRRATGFTNGEETAGGLAKVVPFLLETRMRAAGARFEHALLPAGSHVAIDGNLITGQNPASSTAIARALNDALTARQRAAIEAAAS